MAQPSYPGDAVAFLRSIPEGDAHLVIVLSEAIPAESIGLNGVIQLAGTTNIPSGAQGAYLGGATYNGSTAYSYGTSIAGQGQTQGYVSQNDIPVQLQHNAQLLPFACTYSYFVVSDGPAATTARITAGPGISSSCGHRRPTPPQPKHRHPGRHQTWSYAGITILVFLIILIAYLAMK